ncbi:MAG: hypothetical protein OSA24_03855 [Longimicrobiales bacterium]|nr:hypothetical protein [Longimicrobiales bacterium]
MLMLGMSFSATLQLLLPISLTISLLQLSKCHHYVDRTILRGITIFTLPSIGVALWASTHWSPPLEVFVAILVLTFSLQDRLGFIRAALDRLLEFQRTYITVMGLVHGASNLGGTMLTALAFGKGLGRHESRATIVAGYSLFAIIQLITLYLAGEEWQIDFGTGASLIVSGAITFWLTERYIFTKFDSKKYRKGLEILLVTTGMLLLLSSF